jgi:hypothetical protein
MRRRDFIGLFGGTAAWPIGALAVKSFGINLPLPLLGRADEIIE